MNRRTDVSPLYNITAACVRDVRRIRSRGCSGTTLHSKKRSGVFLEPCLLSLLLMRFQGRYSSPAYLARPTSSSIALRLRDRVSSASSVDKGRMYSRGRPLGARTTHPRIVNVPGSTALPVIVTGWYVFAGITTGTASDSMFTPDVLSWGMSKDPRVIFRTSAPETNAL